MLDSRGVRQVRHTLLYLVPGASTSLERGRASTPRITNFSKKELFDETIRIDRFTRKREINTRWKGWRERGITR